MSYEETLRWLREYHVTWNQALNMRDDPDSRLDEDALRAYLREAAVEFRA